MPSPVPAEDLESGVVVPVRASDAWDGVYAAGEIGEGVHQESGGQQRDHEQVAAEKGRVAGGGGDARVTRLGRQAEQRQIRKVETHHRDQGDGEPDRDVDPEELRPADPGVHRPRQHHKERQPVERGHQPLHTACTSTRGCAEGSPRPRPPGCVHRQARGQHREENGVRGAPTRPGRREQRPQSERHRDLRARVDRLAHREGESVRTPHERGEQKQREAAMDGQPPCAPGLLECGHGSLREDVSPGVVLRPRLPT